ncbi:MAG: DUF3106 domain-containing protein [Planctomycetota bacterium]
MKSALLFCFCAQYALVLMAAAPLLGAGSGADGRARQDPAVGQARNAPERAALRQRWEGLSEQERARLRERFAALSELDPEERARLTERTQRLNQLSRQFYGGLDDAQRRRLDGLPTAKRRELLHEMVLAEARETSRRLWNKLSAADRERLEGVGEQERLEFFAEFRRRQGKRIDRSIEDLGPELGFSATELERLRGLPTDRRRQKFLEMVKRRTLRAVQSRGLPREFPARRWSSMTQLAPEEFYLAILRMRRSFPELGIAHGTDTRATTAAQRRLVRSLQVDLDPAERLALSHLGRAERGAEMRRLKRERALTVIRETQLLPPAEIERLQGLADSRFFVAVRELLPQRGGGDRGGPSRRAPGDRRRPPR